VIGDSLGNRLARRRKHPGVVDQPLEENAAYIAPGSKLGHRPWIELRGSLHLLNGTADGVARRGGGFASRKSCREHSLDAGTDQLCFLPLSAIAIAPGSGDRNHGGMDRRSWSLLLVLGAIWGASYLFIKIGLRDLSPSMVAFVRIALAALVLLPVAAFQGALAGVRARAGWLALVGAVQVAAPFFLISAGEEEISSSLAGILVASAPLFTALLAIWVDHEERSQGLRLAGVLVGFAGVALLLGVDIGGSALLGGLAVVLASLGYAIGGFLVKHRLAGVAPLGMSAAVMVASAIFLLPPALLTAPEAAPGLGPASAVAVLGVLGTGIAFVIFYELISSIGPARAFLVTYIAPGFAVVYGALLLSEEVTLATLVGLALILSGSWLAAEGRLPGRPRVEAEEGPPSMPVAEPARGETR
jgi:drug/metabolite transporter (DMT)-like permease